MIEELTWDSGFFCRKIGRLISVPGPEEMGAEMRHAAREGFKYLCCRIPAMRIEEVQLLERHGFYVTDVSILWFRHPDEKRPPESAVRAATVADRDALIRMSRGIFTDGRFYHDPFFSSEEADRLYETWTANLLGGLADKVFISGDAGFIGCALKEGTGDIPLVGVAEGSQGRGIGTDLVLHALAWFRSQRVDEVTVRTQAGNKRAAALYQRCGFGVKETAVTLGRAV